MEQKSKFSFTDSRATVNVMTCVCHTLGITLNAFLHNDWGERYAGMPGCLAVVILFIYSAFMGDRYNVVPVLIFLYAFIALVGFWKFRAIYRRKTGKPPIHSRYSGSPWLHRLMPKLDEITVKKMEPFLVFFIGAIVFKINVPLGGYLIVAAIGQGISLGISEMIALAKLLDQIDATIDSEASSEAVKKAFGR